MFGKLAQKCQYIRHRRLKRQSAHPQTVLRHTTRDQLLRQYNSARGRGHTGHWGHVGEERDLIGVQVVVVVVVMVGGVGTGIHATVEDLTGNTR